MTGIDHLGHLTGHFYIAVGMGSGKCGITFSFVPKFHSADQSIEPFPTDTLPAPTCIL